MTTEEFENKVRSGYYREVRNALYKSKHGGPDTELKDTWYEDFYRFLQDSGVPEKYIGKVANLAYQQGHSSGEEEILNYAYGLIEIFQEGN